MCNIRNTHLLSRLYTYVIMHTYEASICAPINRKFDFWKRAKPAQNLHTRCQGIISVIFCNPSCYGTLVLIGSYFISHRCIIPNMCKRRNVNRVVMFLIFSRHRRGFFLEKYWRWKTGRLLRLRVLLRLLWIMYLGSYGNSLRVEFL